MSDQQVLEHVLISLGIHGAQTLAKSLLTEPRPPETIDTIALPDPSSVSGDKRAVVQYLQDTREWNERFRSEDDYHRGRETEAADMQASIDAMQDWVRRNPKPRLSDYL